MPDHHIAQLNVGRLVAARDSAVVADFMDNLDAVNALADAAPGFVWRLQDEAGNATGIPVTRDDMFIVNLSVWRSIEQLHAFVYETGHTPFIGRRLEWFERHDGPYMTLWWVEAGHAPSVEEAMARLAQVRTEGPTRDAFTFKQTFAAPE